MRKIIFIPATVYILYALYSMLVLNPKLLRMYEDFGATPPYLTQFYTLLAFAIGFAFIATYFIKEIPNKMLYVVATFGIFFPFIFLTLATVLPIYNLTSQF